MKFLSESKGKYLTQKLITLLGGKVDKVSGKSLSTNDFTDTLKSKLEGIATGANKTTVDSSLNSSSTNPVQNKVVNAALGAKAALASPTFTGTPKAPTATAGTNTTQIATTAFVTAAVAAAVGGITGMEYTIVTTLPSTGEAGIIYLKTNGSSKQQNVYDEYIWLGTAFEKIGTTEIDLSGYVKSTDMVEVTEAEIDGWFTEG